MPSRPVKFKIGILKDNPTRSFNLCNGFQTPFLTTLDNKVPVYEEAQLFQKQMINGYYCLGSPHDATTIGDPRLCGEEFFWHSRSCWKLKNHRFVAGVQKSQPRGNEAVFGFLSHAALRIFNKLVPAAVVQKKRYEKIPLSYFAPTHLSRHKNSIFCEELPRHHHNILGQGIIISGMATYGLIISHSASSFVKCGGCEYILPIGYP